MPSLPHSTVAPIEMLFIPSPLESDGLHGDITFAVSQYDSCIISYVLIRKLQPQSECTHTIVKLPETF